MSLQKENYFEFSDDTIIFEELMNLIKMNNFEKDIIDFINVDKNEMLVIKGTKELFSRLVNFENNFNKIDILEQLINTDFISFSLNDTNKIKECNLKIGNHTVTTTYGTKYDYINLVHLKSFYDICADKENPYDDDIKIQLEDFFMETYIKNKKLLGLIPTKKKLYRLISIKNNPSFQLFLRAICSKDYKNYDNKLTIFMALYVLNKFAIETNQNLKIEKVFMTDSKIKLVIRSLEPKILENEIGKVYPTYEVYNNELGEGSFIISQSYIFNFKDQDIYLNINEDSKNIKNQCLNISHSSKIETLLEKINIGIIESKNYEKILMELATKLYSKTISEHFLSGVIESILNSNKSIIQSSTKEKIKNLETIIDTSKKIIELLKAIDEIKMEYEEKEYINYLFFKILNKLKI